MDAVEYEYDLFLSHNRADKDWTRQFAKRIERETWNGRLLKVFFDEWDIQPGDNIPVALEQALPKSRKFGFVMSPEFFESEWAEFERTMVACIAPANRAKRVVPLYVRDCGELPAQVRPLKYIDFRDPSQFESSYGQLLAFLREEPLPRSDGAPSYSEVPLRNPEIPRPPLVGFVARRNKDDLDLVELVRGLLAKDEVLLVLWGPGGIGKTALAAEVARRSEPDQNVIWASADGRADFSLSTLLDAIVAQVGQIELRKLALEAKADAARSLVAKMPVLLVVDNLDTVEDTHQGRLLEFLARIPCRVLITSRTLIPSAQNIPIMGMLDMEARGLLKKLIHVSPRPDAFAGLDADQVIARAEGNPLVMEWVVGQIVQAKEPRRVFQGLIDGRGDAVEHVFDRSFNLTSLGDDGRTILLALTLFVPDASREALATVTGLNEAQIDDAVSRLVSAALADAGPLNKRIGVKGLTRELAKRRAEREERQTEWKRRFVDYFVEFAESHGQSPFVDFGALESERENLLSAFLLSYNSKDGDSMARIITAMAPTDRRYLKLGDCATTQTGEQLEAILDDLRHPERPRHLRIYLGRAGGHDEEVRRMRELLSLLRSVRGRDRFTFYVPNPQGLVQLDFPNFTTCYLAVEDPLRQMASEWGSLEVA